MCEQPYINTTLGTGMIWCVASQWVS